MNIYTVYMQGVYRHQILGVFDTLENARKRAFLGAIGEEDGYHDFVVAVCSLNEHLDDLKPLYSVTSANQVYSDRSYDSFPKIPESRDVVLKNSEGEIIEVLISMTYDLETK